MQQYCSPCNNHGLVGIKLRDDSKISMKDIVDAGCKFMAIEPELLFGTRRYRYAVECRHVIMNYLRVEKNYFLRQIGNMFNRDHTTVIHAIKTTRNLCETNPDFKYHYIQLVKHLNEL